LSHWPSTKAKKVYRALRRIGWAVKYEKPGSHKILERKGWQDYVWAFHDREEIGPVMLAKIAKKTGLTANEL
jgi:predicted RNA binding protein YcfA (HicA-like mRNA interferase family)